MSSDIYQKATDQALKFLKIRPHSVFELKRKLQIRGFKAQIVDTVVAELSQQELLNDEQFAQVFLDNLIRYKTFGFYQLKAKLLKRGIERAIIEDLLADFSLAQEKEMAKKIIVKAKHKDRVQLARGLAGKGFRSQVIRDVLKTASES